MRRREKELVQNISRRSLCTFFCRKNENQKKKLYRTRFFQVFLVERIKIQKKKNMFRPILLSFFSRGNEHRKKKKIIRSFFFRDGKAKKKRFKESRSFEK
jgi:hypothetical protein